MKQLRKIKFRAWHLHENKMYDVYNLDLLFGRCWSKERRECLLGCDIELMQYTGLKDKNGKEIYEGDIVNYSHPRTNEIIRTVTFKHGAFGIEGIYEKTHIIFGNILDNHIEVIGNIYENPELLTV